MNSKEMKTVTIVIRESLEDHAIYLHRAFERPMEAIHLTEELNNISTQENINCVWRTYTMIVE